MNTEQQLKTETAKWEDKLSDRIQDVTAVDEDGEDLLENAKAYLQDVPHFREQDDWVRAFEAVIWGWSWLEIGERLGVIRDDTA